MRKVYLVSDNIISPIGFSTEENLHNLRLNQTAIQKVDDDSVWSEPFFGALIDNDILSKAWNAISKNSDYTKLEKMMLLSISKLLKENPSLDVKKSGVVISTTKGNINSLRSDTDKKAYLSSISKTIQQFFDIEHTPVVLSNACISGGLALAVGKRMIQSEYYEDVIVVGGDLLSEFTLSGFFSFQAVSDAPCKPFCKNRTGISLGEAAASAWLSAKKEYNVTDVIEITGDASANDANHISGPSRTGEGLYISIQKAMKEAGLESNQIDYITAHGTATPYNDEMEAIAFNRVGLQDVPLNSLKGYYGHTLGASALIEIIVARHCLLNNELFASLGFEALGVSESINVIAKNHKKELNRVLKTASGFGGCNVALIIEKVTS
ncbi:beta-ketoacyl synthase N-terminal-like domain-containing protein [Aquimarina sp. 2201CG14-23]|uniref:beta-ketoacyl synthase N-terminal-like domain-containing protein n=1 Tax=Aquimarina mycalae TaxID=3040073 RepID=UPI002478104D|nr:beta-ketoacyl synthase N-terminal-like domain-containing protein [Aquimarina sp. 2201CG14-23]MDH7446741.1 beta-ketoacyl synthase N-terminal-like domain-containing protein [Aquimarina sp. 2201CG14-23]